MNSSAELDDLVERAQQLVRGIEPQQLRDATAYAHTWPENWPVCSPCWTSCLLTGPAGIFSDAPTKEGHLANILPSRRSHFCTL